jgi:DNA-binding response OmpR family regulator
MAAGRILVVEDDEALRETLTEVMADEGHEARAAANGADALEALRDWTPDVIVLDVMMPTMDAYEFRQRQRATPGRADARVLVLSAARDLADVAARLAADEWLTKPFALAEVIGAVDRLLDGSGSPSGPASP